MWNVVYDFGHPRTPSFENNWYSLLLPGVKDKVKKSYE